VHGEIERQVLEQDDRPRGERHAALDHVLELAHVPRPVVRLERGERALDTPRTSFLNSRAYFFTK